MKGLRVRWWRGQPFEPDPGRAGVGTGNASVNAIPPSVISPSATDPGPRITGAMEAVMPDSAPLTNAALTAKGAEPRVTTGPFPASRKIYAAGRRHPELRVALREIELEASANEPPVRVYDTSGPYSDPAVATDIRA